MADARYLPLTPPPPGVRLHPWNNVLSTWNISYTFCPCNVSLGACSPPRPTPPWGREGCSQTTVCVKAAGQLWCLTSQQCSVDDNWKPSSAGAWIRVRRTDTNNVHLLGLLSSQEVPAPIFLNRTPQALRLLCLPAYANRSSTETTSGFPEHSTYRATYINK